jgi:hypothetical protein
MDSFSEWQVETARSGDPTVFINGKALHSRFDPVREAEKTAASVPREAAIVVLGGLGLGYVAEALLRSAPHRQLIIAEADEGMPARVAALRDIRSILESPYTSIVSGGDPDAVKNLLRGGPAGSMIHLLVWKPSEELAIEWYSGLRSAVEETVRRRQVNARTLEKFGRLWVRNLAANTSILHKALSLTPWKNRFSGIPALVLAGGPSLESVLPSLKKLAEKYLVIAVDTAVTAVLRAGVSPDIITAVDPQYWNTRHLDRCGDAAGDALILTETATHPAVFRSLNGRPWLTRTRFPLGTVLEDAAGIDGELNAGGSVATAAWDLARHLGCSTITIAGLDLGFPGGRTHYSGSLSRERPHFFSKRISPSQTLFFHALRDASPRYVESNDGGTVLTDTRMDIYAAWFTENISAHSHRKPAVVGGQGRKIPGMGIIEIDEMMLTPECRLDLEPLLAELRNSPEWDHSRPEIDAVIKQILMELEVLETLSNQGADLARKARFVIDNGDNADELLKLMEEIDRNLLSGAGREVISFLIQPIILEISTESSGQSDPLMASKRLYEEIANSSAYNQHYLRRALSRN